MFVKLFQQILDSSIADDRRLRHFFTDLLLCADSKGFVMMTDQAIARRTGAPLDEVSWGLAELQKPDPKSKTPIGNGRRIEPVEGAGYGWRIINYEHYRAMKDADQLRESVRERVRRHRAKKAGNADETDGNAGNAMQKKKQRQKAEGEYSIAFESFWKVYPKKKSKGDAWRAWQQLRDDTPLPALLEAVQKQARNDPQWLQDNGQFIPFPATWLRARRWEDDGVDCGVDAKQEEYAPDPPEADKTTELSWDLFMAKKAAKEAEEAAPREAKD